MMFFLSGVDILVNFNNMGKGVLLFLLGLVSAERLAFKFDLPGSGSQCFLEHIGESV